MIQLILKRNIKIRKSPANCKGFFITHQPLPPTLPLSLLLFYLLSPAGQICEAVTYFVQNKNIYSYIE